MYFLKFLNWVWFRHLTGSNRIAISVITWIVLFLTMAFLGITFGSSTYLWSYVMLTVFFAICWGIFKFIKRMQTLYQRWESLVFEELRRDTYRKERQRK